MSLAPRLEAPRAFLPPPPRFYVAWSFLLNGQVIKREDMHDNMLILFNSSYIYLGNEMLTVNEFQAPSLQEYWGTVEEGFTPVSWFGWVEYDKTVGLYTFITLIAFLRLTTYVLLRFLYKETR